MNSSILATIDELQAKIDAYGPLDADLQKKINYKFRLDWNFYSNEMEGNSLTRIETRQLMMDNVTIDGKPFKDIAEMRGHDQEVLEIIKMGKDDMRLSEKRIKAMHKAIMHQDTPEDGQQIGTWKTVNNHLINYRNEKFEFLPHTEVAAAMHRLLDETNAAIDKRLSGKPTVHPALLAFQFHLGYIRIHPFYDGNGRTARLLTNLLLISAGFPPVILRKENRDAYYKHLADIQRYGSTPDLFYDFMGQLLIDSQQLILDALEGKSIEEEDDIDKEIALWKNDLDHDAEMIEKTNSIIYELYNHSIRPLFELFLEKHKQFEDLFIRHEIINDFSENRVNCIGLEYLDQSIDLFSPIEDVNFLNEVAKRVEQIAVNKNINFTAEINQIGVSCVFKGFNKNDIRTFDFLTGITVIFDSYSYKITTSHIRHQDTIEKLYSVSISEKEIKSIIYQCIKLSFEEIKRLKDAPPF